MPTTLTPREADKAMGTIPACDKALVAFGVRMVLKYGWDMNRFCEFLLEPWPYQSEWNKYLREARDEA